MFLWVVVVQMVVMGKLSLSFEHSRERGGYQIWTSANKGERGSKFWVFCDNVMIECPHCIRIYNLTWI